MSERKNASILFEKGLITEQQFGKIKEHASSGIFSLHNEIRFFLFLSVLLFTSGAGIFIYNNIESIGHVAVLTIIFLITAICFLYSFKHGKGFSKQKISSENPAYDYLVLAANVLLGIFIGYAQFQYNLFGTRYGLATLVPTALYFFSAYYFDHKGVLSLAISGLFAAVGFSTSPQAIFQIHFSGDNELGFSVLFLGVALILWTLYAARSQLKEHFNATFLNFALHVISIIAVVNLIEYYSFAWFVYLLIVAAVLLYFIRLAYQKASINFLTFSLIYAYIIFNILLSKLISMSGAYMFIIYLSPFYFIGSILFFRKCIKDFKIKTRNAGI